MGCRWEVLVAVGRELEGWINGTDYSRRHDQHRAVCSGTGVFPGLRERAQPSGAALRSVGGPWEARVGPHSGFAGS